MKKGKLFVISAPSGSGKTTLLQAVLHSLETLYPVKRVVTYTTRPLREGEIDGIDYYHISVDLFKKKIEEDFFLEWSTWYDHYYGSPATILKQLEEGISFILIIDRPGAQEIYKMYHEVVLIWIEPPTLEELENRLIVRGKNSQKEILNRMKKALFEINQEHEERFYKYHIVNDQFAVAKAALEDIIKHEIEAYKKV